MNLVAAALLVLAAEAGDSVDTFFKEFAQHRQGVETVQARFVQKSVTPDEIRRNPRVVQVYLGREANLA